MATREQCVEQLIDGLQTSQDLGPALETLLQLTGARATGCWIVHDGALHQRGFRAVDSMPADVQRDFLAATKIVPLDKVGLGIVKAVVENRPTVMTRQPGGRDPNASPSWLDRFECEQSLVIPVTHSGSVVGALAVSSEERLSPENANWQLLGELAEQIAEAAASVAGSSAAT